MMRTPAGHKVYAMAAEYPSAAALYEAAKQVRDAGFKRWDVYSPFPIHGMDEAMGLGKSWLSGWVLFGGVTGLLTAAVVEFGPSSILYPLIVHGKPYNFFTVPAFFPIMFELTVLFGGVRRILLDAWHERFAPLVPPNVQLGTVYPCKQRRIFPRDRVARSTVHRKRCARIIGKNRRRTHHHCARGLNMLRGFLVIFVLCGIAILRSLDFVDGRAPRRRLRFSPIWCDR